MASYIPSLVKDLWSANPSQVTQYLYNAKYLNLSAFAHLNGDVEEPVSDESRGFVNIMNALGPNEASTLFLLRNASQKCFEWLQDGCDDSTMAILFKQLTLLAQSVHFVTDDQHLIKFKSAYPLALLFALTSDESLALWTTQVIAMSPDRRVISKKSLRQNSVALKKWSTGVWRQFEKSRVEGFETDYADLLPDSTDSVLSASASTTGQASTGRSMSSNVNATQSFEGSSYPRVLQSCKRTQYDTIFIEALFSNCGSVADALIRCAYHRHIRYPPSQQSYETWIRAVQYREAGDDQSADLCVKQAFEIEFWLPLRYAALFSFKPLFPILLPRIEYEAVLTIASVDRHVVPDNIYQVVSNQCSAKTFNPDNIKSTIWWNQTCSHSGGSGCCNFIPCGTPICSMKHRITYEQDIPNVSILPEAPGDWDPSIWAIGILYWKLPDNSFFFEKNSSTEINFGIDQFEVVPPQFEQLLISMSGLHSEESYLKSTRKEDIFQSTHAIYNIRNNSFRTSKPITLVDSWEAICTSISFCHVAKKQAEKWTYGSSGATDLPPENTIATLSTAADKAIHALYSMLPGFVPPSHEHLMTDFEILFHLCNEFQCDHPVSLLLCPPENQEGYAGSFAGMPWTAVLDLCDSATPSPSLWSTMLEAIGQGQFRPGCHNHLRSQARVRGVIDSSSLESILRHHSPFSPLGLPWFQPLLEASGIPRAHFSMQTESIDHDNYTMHAIKQELDVLAEKLLQRAATSISKELLVVFPLNGLFNYPFALQNQDNEINCAFLKEIASDASDDASNVMNYSFGSLAYSFLQSISSASRHTAVRRKIILLLDSVMDENSACLEWVKSALHGTSENTDLIPLHLQPHIFDILFKMRVGDNISMSKGLVSLIAGTDEFPLSKKYKPFDKVVEDSDYPPDVSLESESKQNLSKLKSAGLELLYTQLAQDCLKVSANAMQKKKHGPASVFSSAGDRDPLLSALHKSALDFAVGGGATWPLLDKKLTDPYHLSGLVISRDVSFSIEQEALRLWRHAASGTCVNMLTLTCNKGCGGTTLARRFAYGSAFQGWGAAVFDVSAEDYPAGVLGGVLDLMELCQLISSSEGGVKPLVFLVDREVSDARVKELLLLLQSPAAQEKRLCALVVRVQRPSETISSSSCSSLPASLLSPVSKRVQLSVPAMSGTECSALRAVIKSLCGEDLNMVALSTNPLPFRRAFGMISFGACGDCHESLLFQTAFEKIMREWVDSYVQRLYNLLDEDTRICGGASRRRSALMAVWGMALVQVSYSKCNGFSPQSLLPILESASSQFGLYDHLDEGCTGLSALETDVMTQAYTNLSSLQQQSHQFSSALIPFWAMMEDNFWTELQPAKTTFVSISQQLPRMIGTKFASPSTVGNDGMNNSASLKGHVSLEQHSGRTIHYLRHQLKAFSSETQQEDLLDVFLLTTPEGRLFFTSDAIAERFLDTCMQYELQRAPLSNVLSAPPSPYYLLSLELVRAFQQESARKAAQVITNHLQPQPPEQLVNLYHKEDEEEGLTSTYCLGTLFRHVFALPDQDTSHLLPVGTSLDFAWAVDKVNDFYGRSVVGVDHDHGNVNAITDNKTLLMLLAGLALYPTESALYLEASKVLTFPNWTVNIPDSINHVRQDPSFGLSEETLTSISHARILLCTSMTFASMGLHFRSTTAPSAPTTTAPLKMSGLLSQLMLQTIHVLTLDAKYVLEHVGVPSVKASVLAALPPDLLEASKELFLAPNVLSFLLNLVSDYLLFANIACFHLTSKTYDTIGGEELFVKGIIEGLQEVLSLIVADRMNTEWTHFYRLLVLHDFSKQLDKQKKKYHLCDHIIEHMLTNTAATAGNGAGTGSVASAAGATSGVYNIVCIDDILTKTVDLVFATRSVGNLDATSDLMEHIFYWETLPFNIQSDHSYQNTYRHLFHLERLALNQMTNAETKNRGMMRLARITHLIFSSSHNESNERSPLMQCLMLDSPELAMDLSAMIKTLYECGSQKKCPLAYIADIIDLSTFSNKNELGSINRPISITNLELILKQHFYRLSLPTPNTLSTWLLSKRNYAACLFVQLWGTVQWGKRNGISDNGLMQNVWNEFMKLNGTFNDQTQSWVKGQYDVAGTGVGTGEDGEWERERMSVFDHDELVFTRPGDMDWTESHRTPPTIPSLLRRKFEDVDEANVELGEDELFVLQPVYGTIVHVKSPRSLPQQQQHYFSGYVCVEGMGIYLPFHIDTEYEVQLLKANGKEPYLYQRCSFYVSFKCRYVFAFGIQRAIEDNDRVSLYDMMHAERISRSNNPLYQPRMIRERPFRPRLTAPSDGLNFMEYNMTASPTMEVTKVFNLTDAEYGDLLKNYKETGSSPIQLLSAKEFNMENVTSMVSLQKHIYGRLNFLCTALHTPYEGFDTLPNKSTGWIACPVSRSSSATAPTTGSAASSGAELKSIFPWIEKNTVDHGYLDKQIHWIARDVVSLFVDKAPKFGGSKPTRKVVPQKMDLYESATESYCRKMFVFVSLPKLSLVSVPQGILVLREQSQGGTGHFFDLGVLYFDNKTVHDTRNYLTTIWKRAVGCILNSNWQYLSDMDPSINDSVENIAKRVMENIEEPAGVGIQPSVVAPAVSTAPSNTSSIFTANVNSLAPGLSLSMNGGGMGGTTAALGAMNFLPSAQQQQSLPYFMDMSTAPSLVEPLFPPTSSSVSTTSSASPHTSPNPPMPSYLGIIGQGSSPMTPPKAATSHPPGSFASVLAEASSPPPPDSFSLTASPKGSSSSSSSSTAGSSKNTINTDVTKNNQPLGTSKHNVLASLDGRHGDFKVFVKNLKDFSVNEIQEILGDDVRSITLKLTNKQPNGMCHVTFRTKAGYLAALNRNYEVIAPSINLSISKDTSNDSKFNIDNPVYFTYDEEESVNYDSSDLAQPSESFGGGDNTTSATTAAAAGGVGGTILPSTLVGTHGDYYAFVRGLFYFNSYEVQSFLGTDVRSVTLKIDEDGRPNGMSHVTFNTQEGFASAIGRNNEFIRGKQQLRIASDTKKDLANGSLRSVYFRKPNSGKGMKKERKLKGGGGGRTGKAGTSGNKAGGSNSKNGKGGNLYGAFSEEEWHTR